MPSRLVFAAVTLLGCGQGGQAPGPARDAPVVAHPLEDVPSDSLAVSPDGPDPLTYEWDEIVRVGAVRWRSRRR